MIKLDPAATFPAEVQISQGADKAPASAQFTFRMLDSAAMLRLLIVIGAGKYSWLRRLWERLALCWRLKRLANLADVLDQIIVRWDGFDLPYSRAALVQLLQAFPGVGISIVAAYVTQRQEARIKN